MILYKKIIIKNLHKPVKKFNIIAVMFKISVFLKKKKMRYRGLFGSVECSGVESGVVNLRDSVNSSVNI